MATDFPKKGDDKKVSLLNSNFERFDYAFTLDIKENYPDVWKLGGNIRGNQAFNYWGRARDGDEAESVLDWIREREAWSARHFQNNLAAGVMALAKWGTVGKIGERRMKAILNDEKAKERSRRIKPMNKFRQFLADMQNLISSFSQDFKRAIKTVDEWNGSPTNYSTTDAYCRACLIDVNDAAGNDTKVQSHCLLPVREEGDPASTFVDRAVFAAAGGRGITAVKKPDDVPQDAWDAAITKAASAIIEAYDEMDRVAPASVWELAGMAPPEEARAISFQRIHDQIFAQLQAQMEQTGQYLWPVGVYEDRGSLFVIIAMDGRLYRQDIVIMDDNAILSPNSVRVEESFLPLQRQAPLRVFRQKDGRYRWLMVSCTAVLNRVGQIDTTALFDSFVEHARNTGEYPVLNFHHFKEIRLGQADFLARDGFTYITAGLYDDTEIGRKAAEGVQADPDYWGHSIEFFATESGVLNIGDLVQIPAHLRGFNSGIALLAEDKAASLFTGGETKREGDLIMNTAIKQDLTKLVGEELADEFEQQVDATNRTIEDARLIARSTDDATETGTDEGAQVNDLDNTDEDAPIDEAEEEIVLGDEVIPTLVDAILADGRLQAALTEGQPDIRGIFIEALQPLQENIRSIGRRLEALEAPEEERREAWQADVVPAPKQTRRSRNVTFRAKNNRQPQPKAEPNGKQGRDLQSIADSTLAGLPKI